MSIAPLAGFGTILCRMLKKPSLLTRPTPARQDAPCPKQGRSFAADPRFTFHASRFTVSQHPLGFLPEEERSIEPGDGDGDEFDRQQQSAYNGVRCGGREDEMQAEEFGSL
jgi:hypothetical protein